MSQSLMGVMDGLFTAATACYASSTAPDGSPVFVCMGGPGQFQPDAIVAVMDCLPSQVTRPTMGTNRSRELVLDTTVMFSVYAPGGNEAHQTALDSITALIRLFEDYIRTSPNEKLGGACYDSWVSAVQGVVGSIVYDPDSVAAQAPAPTGRVVEAPVTVTSKIRY